MKQINKASVLGLMAMASVSVSAAPALAAETLVGDEVRVGLTIGPIDSTKTVVVGPGEEGNFFGNQFFDFGSNTFSIRSTSSFCGIFCNGEPVVLSLTDLDLGSGITGVSFTTLLSGVTSSFTSNSVTFRFSDQPLPPTTYLSATFATAVAAPVPEPATWAMMLVGFGLVGGAMRRRQLKVTYATA